MTDCYVAWKGWDGREFGSFELEDALYYKQELDASGIRSVQGLRVGELGYGNGTFAGWVRKAGGHWVGREAIDELQERASQAGFEIIGSEAAFSNGGRAGTLDLIVAFDVIEHLELDAIRSFLRDVREALRPGGLLLIRFPSGDSPFSGSVYRADLTHRTLLGSTTASQLATETGLEVCQIRSPVLPILGLGPVRALRRFVVRLVQVLTFSFVRHFLMSDSGAVLSPNMIVLLRKAWTQT